MTRALVLLALLAAAAEHPEHPSAPPLASPSAQSQSEGQTPQDGSEKPHREGIVPSQESPPPPEPEPEPSAPAPAPMSEADARMNFTTVVETYVISKTARGFWAHTHAPTGKLLKLKLLAIDRRSIRFDGSQATGRASVRELGSGQTLQASFTVDFTGSNWAVTEAEVLGYKPRDSGYEAAVKAHVRRKAGKAGYVIDDSVLRRKWRLRLARIHTEKIVSLGEDRFFACADFKEIGGKRTLDLDFYARRAPGGWVIEEVLLHKVAGKPRFTYDTANERVPAD